MSRSAQRFRLLAPVAATLCLAALLVAPTAAAGSSEPRPSSPASTSEARPEEIREVGPFSESILRPDGATTVRVFAAPAFRRTTEGWVPVDMELRSSSSHRDAAVIDGAPRPLRFGRTANRLLALDLDQGPLTIGSEDLHLSSAEIDGQDIVYRDVAPDTDLRYRVTPSGVKQVLVLRSDASPRSFTFQLRDATRQLGDLVPGDGGDFRFETPIDGDVAVGLAPAFAYEMAEDDSSSTVGPLFEPGSANQQVRPAPSGWDVTLAVDETWADGKQYPIALDPTVTFSRASGQMVAGAIAYIPSGCGGCAVANTTTSDLGAGTYTGAHKDYEPGRSIFRFDLSSIPTEASVSSATLGLYLVGCFGDETEPVWHCDEHDYDVDLHELTGTWNAATSNWDHYASITSPLRFATDRLTRYVISQPSCTGCRWETFDIASRVQTWVTNPSSNNGFVAKTRAETYNTGGPYWSYQGPYGPGGRGFPQPYLEVTYTYTPPVPPTPPSAAESFGGGNPSQIHYDCQATSHPVNCRTGNFWHTFTDLALPGRGVQVDASRTYNSLGAAIDGPYGFGWSASQQAHLEIDGSGAATVTQENGSLVTFAPDGGGGFIAPARVLATLTRDAEGNYSFVRRQRETLRFDAGGRLTGITDRNGESTTLTYGPSGLQTVQTAGGRTITYAWSGGHIERVTDHAGRSAAFEYDAAGDLVATTDVGGEKTTFTYDSQHRLLTMTDPAGGTVTNVYDATGRVTSQTNPVGDATTFVYGSSQTTVTDPAGGATTYGFVDGLLAEVVQGSGTSSAATWTYGHNSPTLGTTSVTDPLGRTSRTTYDAQGRAVRTIDALGRVTERTYSPDGDLLSILPPAGSPTTFTYDGRGNVLTESRVHVESGAVQRTTFEHADLSHPGDTTAVTDPTGRTWLFEQDDDGNQTAIIGPDGSRSTFAFDELGRLMNATTPLGNVVGADPTAHRTSYAYDVYGRQTEIRNAAGREMHRTFDEVGNLIAVTTSTGTTEMSYDLARRLLATQQADGSSTRHSYDDAGRPVSRTDGNGRTTTYTYDALGRPRTETDPLGRSITINYDRKGNRTSVVQRDGSTVGYTYDAGDRLTRVDGDSASADFAYAPNGQRATMTTLGVKRDYTYDSLDRVLSTTDTKLPGGGLTPIVGGGVAYSYDLADRVATIQVTSRDVAAKFVTRTTSRKYDIAGRLASVADTAGLAQVDFAYDADGRLIEQTNGNETSTAYLFDDAGATAEIVHRGAGGTPFIALPYQRDDAGRTTADSVTGNPLAVSDRQFTYDHRDRIVGTAVATSLPTTYAYDPAQNLTDVQGPAVTEELEYDAADQLTTRVITAAGNTVTTAFQFDLNGQRVLESDEIAGTSRYGYDRLGRLTEFTAPAATAPEAGLPNLRLITQRYAYDADGLLTDFQWDQVTSELPVAISDGNQNVYLVGPAGLPVAQIDRGDRVLYFHADKIGSTRALTGPAGGVVASYTYDEWGRSLGAATSTINPFQFAGQITDVQSGLIYMRARWYDPDTRQFVSRDPFAGATGETYAYASNSPVDMTDPTGLFAQQGCSSGGYRAAEYDDNYETGDPANYHWCRHAWRHPSRINQCRRYRRGTNWALNASEARGGPVGERNARRHCMWAAVLTMDIGEDAARGFMTRHEEHTPNDHDHYVDLWNNEIGIAIGHDADSRSEIEYWCGVALWIGQLDRTGG